MAQIRNFTSTNDSYFVLDGVSYPKVYEAMLDNGYTKDRVKLVGTNRDSSPLVFSTHYSNIRVDGASFASANAAISRLNQVVFSKGGGSGGGGTTGDYIPLTGTEAGKPVTGIIESKTIYYDENDNIITDSTFTFDGYSATFYDNIEESTSEFRSAFIDLRKGDFYNLITEKSIKLGDGIEEGFNDSFIEIENNHITFNKASLNNEAYSHNTLLKASAKEGLYIEDVEIELGTRSGTVAITEDLSYSTTETKTGGTWIDGKPIYTITKLTADPIPADMETQFPNIIVGSYTVYKYTKTSD